jgi:hypothetical protein
MKLTFDPEYIPDAAECGSLTTITKMPGYAALHKILKSVVDQFLVELREANTADPIDCVERVRRSQVATEIYQRMVDRVNLYVQVYIAAEEAGENPLNPDPASELDMDFTTDVDNLVSYFDFEEGPVA